MPREAPLWAASLALLSVLPYRVYKDFLSIFEPHVGPHSLGLMTIECEFCTALHFIQEAISSSREHQLFESCCKKGDAYLDLLKGVPPYLRTLFESQTSDEQHFCQNILAYNNALAFTSVSVEHKSRADFAPEFAPDFKLPLSKFTATDNIML